MAGWKAEAWKGIWEILRKKLNTGDRFGAGTLYSETQLLTS